jgi:hypothetical protein
MKTSLFIGGAFLTFVLTAATGLRLAQAENCQDVLDNNVYRCQVKSDFDTPFEDCFRFTSPGVQSDKFDLFVDGLGIVQGCSCKAGGSFNTPDFGASKEFQCVTTGIDDFGIAFNGRADGTQLKKGQAVNEFGDSFLFQCKLDPTCSIGGGAAVRGAGNPYQH